MGSYNKQFKEEAMKLVTKQGYKPAEFQLDALNPGKIMEANQCVST